MSEYKNEVNEKSKNNKNTLKIHYIIFLYDTHQKFLFGNKVLCTLLFYHHHNPKLRIITMADDNNTDNFTANIEGPSIASSGVQPFHVPVHLIDKNTIIDADVARKYYQYNQFFDLTMIHNLWLNLPHTQQQPINSYNDDIGRNFKSTKTLSKTSNKTAGCTYTI